MFGWCQFIEGELGWVKFLAAYLATGIGASAVSVLAHRVVGAGASGAGFGMIGLFLTLLYRQAGGWDEFIRDPNAVYILKSVGIWFLIGMFVLRLDNYAHLGGMFFGVLIGLPLSIPPEKADGTQIFMYVAAGVVLVGTVTASLSPRWARHSGGEDPES